MNTILYVSTGDNKLNVVRVDGEGNLLNLIQEVGPIVDPIPIKEEDKKRVATEWLTKHPKFNLLFAFTSF